MNNEIESIISGESEVKHGNVIQAIASYLRRSSSSGKLDKREESIKDQEKALLIDYVNEHSFWVESIDFDQFISSGAEQRVYLRDSKYVLKLNDAVYYSTWLDYLYNLLLNNYFFPDTAYRLIGFYKNDTTLYAVVEQPFVKSTELTNIDDVKNFMISNGFINIRNNDYEHLSLGILLEDLHDENVLTEKGVLRFIDTVFYIKVRVFK